MSYSSADIIAIISLSPSRRKIIYNSTGTIVVTNHSRKCLVRFFLKRSDAEWFTSHVFIHKNLIRCVLDSRTGKNLSDVLAFTFDTFGSTEGQIVVLEWQMRLVRLQFVGVQLDLGVFLVILWRHAW